VRESARDAGRRGTRRSKSRSTHTSRRRGSTPVRAPRGSRSKFWPIKCEKCSRLKPPSQFPMGQSKKRPPEWRLEEINESHGESKHRPIPKFCSRCVGGLKNSIRARNVYEGLDSFSKRRRRAATYLGFDNSRSYFPDPPGMFVYRCYCSCNCDPESTQARRWVCVLCGHCVA
jgi:hypothetical protein